MDVGANEVIRSTDGAIHVAFRGKVHDGSWLVKLQQSADKFAIANVTLGEAVSRIRSDAQQVAGIARVGQLVEVDYWSGFLRDPLQDKVGTDESRSSGDQNRFFHVSEPSCVRLAESALAALIVNDSSALQAKAVTLLSAEATSAEQQFCREFIFLAAISCRR